MLFDRCSVKDELNKILIFESACYVLETLITFGIIWYLFTFVLSPARLRV